MKHAGDLTAEDKADFLELIYDGYNRAQAAEQLDTTGTQFRKLCNPVAENYDSRFAQAYEAAINSDQHKQGELELLRDLQWKQMEKGDSQMIQKMSLIKDPAWASLRHQNFSVNVNFQRLVQRLPWMTTAELEAELKELEGPHPVIEAA
jgi:hypothetical protein